MDSAAKLPDRSAKLLLVDDQPANLQALEVVLEPLGRPVVRAQSGQEALRRILEEDFAVVLLDVQMDGMNGFETAKLIRGRRRSRQTPIIFLTAYESDDFPIDEAYSLGVVDCLFKPVRPQVLRTKVAVFVELFETAAEAARLHQAQLNAAETKYRALVEQSLMGIYMIEGDRFTYVNPKMCAIFGRTAEEMTSQPLLDFIAPEDRGRVAENVDKRLRGAVPDVHYTLRMLHQDGHVIHAEVHGARADFDGRQMILGSLLDVSERHHAEEAIRRLTAELEQRVVQRTAQLEAANKELEAFSYSVSHDLRAPLRAMDGFSRILLEEHSAQLDPQGQEFLGLVRTNAQQMGRLVDDLLAFARLSRQAMEKKPVDSDALVRQCLETLCAEEPDRPVEIKLHELGPCRADPALLKQVWLNLLANALKYTRRRAHARIEVGCRRDDGAPPVYYVNDNGVGFDMRYAHKLFGVFQRLHRAEDYEGTGVGLAIVQRVVHRHGGYVWAEAAPNQGATFSFTLEGNTVHD